MKKTMLLALLGTVAMASGTFEVMGSTETKIKNDQKVSEAVKGTKGKATAKVDVVFGETGLSAGAKLTEEIKHDAKLQKLQFKLKPFEAYVKYAMPEYDGFNASVKGSVVVEQDKFDVYEFTKKFKLLVDGSYKLGDATLYGSSEHEFKGYEASKIDNTINLGVKGKTNIVSGKANLKLVHNYERFRSLKASGDIKVEATKDVSLSTEAYTQVLFAGEEYEMKAPTNHLEDAFDLSIDVDPAAKTEKEAYLKNKNESTKKAYEDAFNKAKKDLKGTHLNKKEIKVEKDKVAVLDGAKIKVDYTGLKDKKIDNIYAGLSYDHGVYDEDHTLKAMATFGIKTSPFENFKLNGETAFGYGYVKLGDETQYGLFNFNLTALYDYKATEKLTITPSFKLVADVAFDSESHYYVTTLTPKLSAKYMATENLTLNASAEAGFKFAGGHETYNQANFNEYVGANVKTNVGIKYTW